MEENKEVISKEDLETLLALENRANTALVTAKLYELEYENATLRLYIKYGLHQNDSFDKVTGMIIRSSSDKNQIQEEDENRI